MCSACLFYAKAMVHIDTASSTLGAGKSLCVWYFSCGFPASYFISTVASAAVEECSGPGDMGDDPTVIVAASAKITWIFGMHV